MTKPVTTTPTEPQTTPTLTQDEVVYGREEQKISVAQLRQQLIEQGGDPATIEALIRLYDDGEAGELPEASRDGFITESEVLVNAERRGYLHGINDETVARLLHKQALPFKHVTDFVTVAEYRDYHQREELWEKQLATFVVGVRILQEGFGWQGEERIPMMTSLDRVYELHHEGKKTASKSTQSNVGEDSSNAEGAEFEKESLHDLIDLFQGKSLEDFSESDPADEPVSLPNQLDFEKYDGNIVVSEEVAPEELENEARYLNSQALKDVEEETEAPESGEKIMSPICIKK